MKIYIVSITFSNGNKVSGPGYGQTPTEAINEFAERCGYVITRSMEANAHLVADQDGMRADLIGRTEGF
jgi:hypothetical protein